MNTKSKSRFTSSLLLLYQTRPKTSQGFILFTVIALTITLSGLLVAYAILAKVQNSSTKSTASGNSGFYGTEAALNTRADNLRRILLDYQQPAGTSPSSLTDCFTPGSSNVGSGDYQCRTQIFAAPDDSMGKIAAYSYVVEGETINSIVPPGESFQGLSMAETRYSLNAVAKKENSDADEILAITQMAVKTRLIPLFQFAAFYTNDLEILPGPTMTLSGPVHTNGSLYLGANNNNGLNINGQVTVGRDLFNKRKNDNSTYPNGRVRIANAATTLINLLSNGTGSATQTTAAMTPALVSAAWGTQVQLGIEALSVPAISTLESGGDFEQKADIRIRYTPPATTATSAGGTVTNSPNPTSIPFEVTAIKRQADGTATTTENLEAGKLRSLRQPVMVPADPAAYPPPDPLNYGLCAAATPATPGVTLNATQKTAVAKYLYAAIVAQTQPMAYHSSHPASGTFGATNSPLTAAVSTTLNTFIDNAQDLNTVDKTTLKTALAGASPESIAAVDNRCFIPAPLQDIGRDAAAHASSYRFFNNREGRDIRLLQINIQSLTAWNSDGQYVTFNVNNPVIPASLSATDLLVTNETLFDRADADGDAVAGTFQALGLAASDTSHGGLVIHATINNATYPSSTGVDSPYAFALVQGERLPGLAETANTLDPTGLTFASDQAVYIVGDYNNLDTNPLNWPLLPRPLDWQPASVLSDSLNILSRTCLTTDVALNKNSGTNCTGGNPVDTFVNTALMSGTDITNSTEAPGYNGGLENYPRFSENWAGRTLFYRGSFVSTGTPRRVSGTWTSQAYGAPGRTWDYDTRFNLAKNLPPLTPRFVFIKQESFTRNFDQ